MEHYVTLFDSLFLPQGLALHISMERHVKTYTLWVLCMDEASYDVLAKLNLPNVRLLQVSKLETAELLRVKPTRKKNEYCWTLTPFSIRFVFEADSSVRRVTYLDADVWFSRHPAPIFEEFEASGKHVLITDHDYAPEYNQATTSGQYCVQFMTFTREGGEEVRKWWEERCIEWCYARFEDGKFGDQKYLDDWPKRFPRQTHVLINKEFALAPWNAIIRHGSNEIFFHFHMLRIAGDFTINIGGYQLPRAVMDRLYRTYVADLRSSVEFLERHNYSVRNQSKPLGFLKKSARKIVNVYMFLKYGISNGTMKW